MRTLRAVVAALVASTGLAPQAWADTGEPAVSPSETAYPAAFFSHFQPQSALDMLERTPGFVVDGGSDARGFGATAGNVLIDGQRPTLKSGGIKDVLQRISAAQVVRVVLIQGGRAGEAQGQTLIANVVLNAAAGNTGLASVTLSHYYGFAPSGSLSYQHRFGAWQASAKLSGGTGPAEGYDNRYLVRDAAGVPVEGRRERVRDDNPNGALALSLSGPLAGGTLSVNGRLLKSGYSYTSLTDIHAGGLAGSLTANRQSRYDDDSSTRELGFDWTRGLGDGWAVKIMGLGRIERSDTDADYQDATILSRTSRWERATETVGRATVTRDDGSALRFELGGEIARNTLRSTLDYQADTGAGFVPVILSGADTDASELRGEAFINGTYRLVAGLQLEAGLTWEHSRIRVSGDATRAETLRYWKPSLALVWQVAKRSQLRLGARRTVDQLSFGDFAASVSFLDNQTIGGNAEIAPARVTRAFLKLDHRWGSGGAVSAELYHQWRQGFLGYILLPSGDQALGPIGTAREWGIKAEASLPLTAILPGGLLKIDTTLRDSTIRDRITGRNTPVNGIYPVYVKAELRQDVTRLRSAWGISYTSAYAFDRLYLGEHRRVEALAVWTAYVETGLIAGFKTTVKAQGIGSWGNDRVRRFYAPTRSGSFTGSEERALRYAPILSLAIARQF